MNRHCNSRLLTSVACLVLSLALLVFPARPAVGKSIGLIMPLCCVFGDETKEVFSKYLRSSGIPAGEVEILVQRPGTDKVSLLNSIRKLIAYDVEILVVFGGSAAQEAAKETRKIPVVFIGAYDPVEEGLVTALDQPGKNLTGVSCKTSLPFLLDNIQETVRPQSIGVIYHSDNQDSLAQLSELEKLSIKRGFQLVALNLRDTPKEDLARKLQSVQFVYLAAGCYPDFIGAGDLSGLSVPIATQCQDVTDSAVLFSLAADSDESISLGAKIVSRLLGGEKPGSIPVSSVKKIDFTIDMRVAKRLGVKVPFTVLPRATNIRK